jgi:hypothetical protein
MHLHRGAPTLAAVLTLAGITLLGAGVVSSRRSTRRPKRAGSVAAPSGS